MSEKSRKISIETQKSLTSLVNFFENWAKGTKDIEIEKTGKVFTKPSSPGAASDTSAFTDTLINDSIVNGLESQLGRKASSVEFLIEVRRIIERSVALSSRIKEHCKVLKEKLGVTITSKVKKFITPTLSTIKAIGLQAQEAKDPESVLTELLKNLSIIQAVESRLELSLLECSLTSSTETELRERRSAAQEHMLWVMAATFSSFSLFVMERAVYAASF